MLPMADWPFTGREPELGMIAGTLHADSRYAGVVIVGGAGVGKTRLAAEAVNAAQRDGWVVHSVTGTAVAQSIPLGVFAEWIEGFHGELISLVNSVISALTAAPPGKRVLIAVDDAQLLDDTSAFVIHQLARRRAARVIVTVRTGQSAAEKIKALWKDELLSRIDLAPLSQQESDALLQRALGGVVAARTAQRVWDLTQGNALFLYQLVRQELQAGRLASTATAWKWSGEIAASSTLVDLIDLYIGAAPDGILEVMDLIAVAEPLELAYLSAVADPAIIEEAMRRELVTMTGSAHNAIARLAHPLYGEVRRARMGPLRAARLRGLLAEAMNSPQGGTKPADPVRLALLWLESDRAGEAGVLMSGAAQAFLRLDLDLTNRLCEGALAAGAGIEARLMYALSMYSVGRVVEAETMLDSMPSSSPDFLWMTTVMIKAANRQFFLNQPEEARKVVDDALARAPAEIRPQIEVLRVTQLAMAARPGEAVRAAEALDTAWLSALPAAILACGEVIALGDLGRTDAAITAVDACNRKAANAPEAAHQLVGLNLLYANTLVLGGYLEQVLALGEQLHSQWAEIPRDPSAVALAIRGMAALATGDLRTAQEQLHVAITDIEARHDRSGGMYLFWLAYAEAVARAGDVDAAVAAFQQVEHYRHPSYVFIESDRLRVAAWVAAARGEISEALVLAGDAAEFAHAHGQFAREVMSLQSAIQFGDRNHHDRLAELAGIIDGPRAQVVARWATAVASSDGDELLRISHDLEEMGDRIAAADASAHAALAFEHCDLQSSRLIASGRATRLITACGGVTPATRAAATSLPLSDREREIAILVSRGLTNRQIAESLVTSIRTVEGHIYRACSKLRLTNRSELADIVRQFAGGASRG